MNMNKKVLFTFIICVILLPIIINAISYESKKPMSSRDFFKNRPVTMASGGEFFESNGVPLYEYVKRNDSNYKWFDTGYRYNEKDWDGYLLNVTSQAWLTPQEVDCHIWTHQLIVIKPKNLLTTKLAGIWVTAGSNHADQQPPSATNTDIIIGASLAVKTQGITGVLLQIPNQACTFAADPIQKRRTEDALVSITWRLFTENTNRPDIIAYFPMVKAVFRAMDTMQAYVAQQGWGKIKEFLIAGASKRGATTWLVGAVDRSLPKSEQRVSAIVPIVFDMLNFSYSVPHMFEAYGGWTFAFKDYWEQDITEMVNTDAMRALASVVDPLAYDNELAQIPKYIVTATGDEFFMPDDDYYWWDKLSGEKHRLMIPNAEHSLATGIATVFDGVTGFHYTIREGKVRPAHDWTISEVDGTITMTCDALPSKVEVWYAKTIPNTPNRRDFRMIKGNTPAAPCLPPAIPVKDEACFNPIVWKSQKINYDRIVQNKYVYNATLPIPTDGNWLGYLLMAEYDGYGNGKYIATTQVSIVPRVYPFKPCGTGKECKGDLV